MIDERWLPVVDWEGLYEVSDQGRVRSIARMASCGLNRMRLYPGRILKATLSDGKYRTVHLSDGTRKQVRAVHILALEAFVGPCPPGMEGCHFNDDGDNNVLENLRWDTPSGNMQDRIRNGNHYHTRPCCGRGHEYTEENARINRQGHRECRLCARDRARKARAAA